MRTFALVTLLLGTAASAQAPTRLEAAPVDGGIRVHVHKRGLFSAFAHDHDFEVTRWRGALELAADDPGHATMTVTAAADSLRDREHGLSGDDREKVEKQTAGPDILDAAHSPEIVYRAERVGLPAPADAGPVRGTIHGELTLRGRTRPVDASFEAERDGDGWRARGSARFRQSDFGIKPFTGAGGTVGVKDEVEVAFALALRAPTVR